MPAPGLHPGAAAPAAASGADVANGASQATPAEIEALIREIQDPTRRSELIRQLEALKEARQASDGTGQPLANLDIGEVARSLESQIRQAWHQLQNVDVSWLLQQLVISAAVIVVVAVVYRYARRGLRHLRRKLERRSPHRAAQRGARLGERLLLVSFMLLALATLLQLWGVSLIQWLTEIAGLIWIRAAAAIALICAATMALWGLSDTLIAGAMEAQSGRLSDPRQRSRLRTVTPLIQGTMRIAVAVIAIMLILAQLGVNIGPLLAGAGIIGLAVGFGAQSLIKDLLIGVSLLLEDAASVGDVVQVGDRVGAVEKMGIRVMRLRAVDGTVHLIPYSEVATISNLTKDYAYALLDVGVSYRESVDEVIETLEAAARDLREDDTLGPLIQEDLEVMGVDAFADSAVTIRVRLKTAPLERWRISRAFRRAIKARFDGAGIEIPFPHRTLYFGTDKQGWAPPVRLADASADASTGAPADGNQRD